MWGPDWETHWDEKKFNVLTLVVLICAIIIVVTVAVI